MNLFGRSVDPHLLVVGMTGVKLGDRFAQVGCAHGGRLAAVARQVGLSGHSVAIVPDEASATRARKGAADAGVLVDVQIAPPTQLPLPDRSFDLVVVDETAGLLATMPAEHQTRMAQEVQRILKPGGRLMIIATGQRRGLGALFARGPIPPPFDAASAFQVDGFRSVRRLAEREGLVFVEGIKPRQAL
jgi:ubiquinone/menaquinone biosynthesis C-methylase UbiE